MDNQDPQVPPVTPESSPHESTPMPLPPAGPVQPNKPSQLITDADAQALLAMTSAISSKQTKSKLPMSLIITIIGMILLILITTFLIGSVGKGGKLKTPNQLTSGLNSQNSSGGSGSGIHNQINQDVKTCSNPVNAVTEC